MTVAMITHAAPGDTFWDIVRKGAEAAAAKDNVELEYSTDPDATNQANLVQTAIDKKVDGIAVTVPNTGALGAAIKKAVAAGIPVSCSTPAASTPSASGASGTSARTRRTPAGVGQRIVKRGRQEHRLRHPGPGPAAARGPLRRRRGHRRARSSSSTSTAATSRGDDDDPAKLKQDKSIDYVITLGAPFALTP